LAATQAKLSHFHTTTAEAGYAEEDGCKMSLLYNYDEQRVEVKIIKPETNQPRIIVTFEPGYPDYDSDEDVRQDEFVVKAE
jgi:hypothetical protein